MNNWLYNGVLFGLFCVGIFMFLLGLVAGLELAVRH